MLHRGVIEMKIITFRSLMVEYYQHYHEDCFNDKLSIELLDKDIAGPYKGDIFIGGRMSAEQLVDFPELKMIIVPYTGLNGLDLVALKKAGIRALKTSAHGIFVAERALALTLALRGKLVEVHNNLVKGSWSERFEDYSNAWHSIYNKKIAIYGYGTIGQEIGRLLAPFGVEIGVLSYKNRDSGQDKTFDSLADLCEWCDGLIVAAPLTKTTKNSVNDAVLGKLTGKFIINVGRGKIIDEEALYNHLEDKRLAGFASDVWYNYPTKDRSECHPSHYPLHEFDHVVMTPHNAGFEVSADHVRYEDVLKQILAYIEEVNVNEGT